MPLILGAQSATADAGYQIEKSCRFNNPDSPSMSYAIGSDGSLVACTINVWFKSNGRGVACPILQQYVSGTSAKLYVGGVAAVSSNIQFYSNRTGESPAEPDRITTAQYGDPAAWYNIHCVFDSANGVAEDRMRVYVNGTRVTAWDTNLDPQLNANWGMFNYTDGARTLSIGTKPYGSAAFLAGYLANLIVCDGQTYDPDKFGEFDEDSPTVWRPIDPAEQSLTFGTHGFWLDFADSAALGNDVSGENNDFTPSNLAAADQATDTPTNNFCTINPLAHKPVGTAITSILSEGNCLYTSSGAGVGNNSSVGCTIGFGSGKFYWETKTTNTTTGWLGVTYVNLGGNADSNGYMFGGGNGAYGISTAGEKVVDGSQTASVFTALSANDIMSFAYDLDNGYFYFGVNGTYVTSGDPTSGSSGTGAIDAIPHTLGRLYYPIIGNGNYGASSVLQMNFGGCPTFTIASGNADADGYGNFEYAPPSGYFALCTKNLAEYG
jgi:hypothetical protein